VSQQPVRLAIDFGTTNSVIAASNGPPGSSSMLYLPGLGLTSTDGSPLIPSLVYLHDGQQAKTTVGQAVRADRPFTAVVEGALKMALGYGVQDYLAHGYGIRHLDPHTGMHRYDEIIPMGSTYPTHKPVEVSLGAAHSDQQEIELVVGEIDTEAVSLVEVVYENGQAVFVAQAGESATQVTPLNLDSPALAALKPAGQPDEERIRAEFRINERRQLLVTVTDLQTRKKLLRDQVLTTLR
jgi:molecular chaperone DnaK (HSP70)